MREIDGASSAQDASAENVMAWIESFSIAATNDLSERFKSVLNSVNYTSNNEDPSGGVSNFMLSVMKILDRNTFSEILKDPGMNKKYLDLLVKEFDPPVQMERIEMKRSGWKMSQISDIRMFKNEFCALAVYIYFLTEKELERFKSNKRQSRNRREFFRKMVLNEQETAN